MFPHQEEDPDPGDDDDGERKEEAEDEERDVVTEVLLVLPGRGAAHAVPLNDVAAPAQQGWEGQSQAPAPGENHESDHNSPAVGHKVALKY